MSVDVLHWEGLLAGRGARVPDTEPERDARFAPLPDEPRPARARPRSACQQLYAHQRAAWDAAARGEHVLVTTGTASGKTLAFNLPVLDALARDPKTRALYLYPTKALAQDQFRTLSGYRVPKLRPAIYDGDTPTEQRWQIRKRSNVDPHEPRHAPRRRPAEPRPLGRRAREPPLRRRRRGARLPRRLRLARRERAAPPAAARARSTAPSRSSCSRRRRSRTPASSARRCSASR